MKACSSLTGLVSSNRRWHGRRIRCATPKFRQIDLAWPRCRKPLGSGGNRVTTRVDPAGVEVGLHDVADEVAPGFGRRTFRRATMSPAPVCTAPIVARGPQYTNGDALATDDGNHRPGPGPSPLPATNTLAMRRVKAAGDNDAGACHRPMVRQVAKHQEAQPGDPEQLGVEERRQK